MDLIKPLAKYILDPLLAIREKSTHRFWLAQFEKTQYYTPAELQQWQNHHLSQLLAYAYENCPYYQQMFNRLGLMPSEIATCDDLGKLDLLTKKDIQNNQSTLKAQNYNESSLIANRTGGSTGAPLEFYLDRERLYSRKAATIRHDRWAGLDIGDKVAVLWGARADFTGPENIKKKMRTLLYERRIFLDTSDLNREYMHHFIDRLNKFRPRFYLAYANSLYLFARYLKEKNIRLNSYPQSIITSAELLEDEQRQLIETVFNAPVFDRYGCRETSVIASECSEHNGHHLGADGLIVEIIKDNQRAEKGEAGKIVITDLFNYGQPLIRYNIEDVGMLLDNDCSCPIKLPLLKITGGRTTDFLLTPEGKVISGASLTIYFIAHIKGIAQAQIIQEQKDFIILKIVKSDAFSDNTKNEIAEQVAYFFGPKMKYELEFTEKITPTASGKHRFSISKLDPMENLE